MFLGIILTIFSLSSHGTGTGLAVVESENSVKEVSEKLQGIIKEKGLNLFTVIDHSKNAKKVGLTLKPTQVIIFGNPNVGTLFMQKSDSVAIDLPQKFLVVEREEGKASIIFNDPTYLSARHSFVHPALSKVAGLLKTIADSAAN